MKIALFNPEIAGNVGSIIRSCACFGVDLHIIEPCGFPFNVDRIKRSALDYLDYVNIIRHNDFISFYDSVIAPGREGSTRLLLATTKGNEDFRKVKYKDNDIVIFGTESGGFPEEFLDRVDKKITIPMKNNMRSLNLAVSCAIILAVGS